MSTEKQIELCWSLCCAARRGVASARIMFRASLLYAETTNPQVMRALAQAFDPAQLRFRIGAASGRVAAAREGAQVNDPQDGGTWA